MRKLLPSPASLLLILTCAARLHAAGLEDLIGEYSADRRDLAAARSVPWSAVTMKREDELLSGWEARLNALDYEQLDAAGRIDWHLLDTKIRERQEDLQLQRGQLLDIHPLIAFAGPLQQLLLERTQRQLADPEKSAAILAQAITDLKAVRKQIDAGRGKDALPENSMRVTPVQAMRAAGAIDELKGALDSWYSLYDGFQPEFTWWAGKPHETLAKEMSSLADFLRKEIAKQKGEPDDPLVGDPIGAEGIRAALQAEMIPYTAEELLAMADRQFAWCEEEMKKAAADLGCTTTAEAVAKIKEQHAPPGGQAPLALEEANNAIRFVKEHELVTIPPLAEETWGLAMIGEQQQKSLPYAVYSQPRMMVAFATESMSHEDKLMSMRGNNLAFLHIVTPHELIPGHHLQGFMARRYAAYRSPFYTPFLVEGWALHWEMLLWDQGYLATPEQRAGALFWRMHRCARIITTLKFHLGQMSSADMIDFLVTRVGHERSGATSEVRRYIGGAYEPLYQVAYMTGGLQLGVLQKELCSTGEQRGIQRFPRMSIKDFHDRVLKEGPIPIEMIRAALTEQKLPKDWKPSWKFVEEL